MFFAGKIARVTSVHEDVDGDQHVGVVVEDDPAADLHEWYGRYLYFSPDEIEPLDEREISPEQRSPNGCDRTVIAGGRRCVGAGVVVGVESMPDMQRYMKMRRNGLRGVTCHKILVAGIGNIFLGDDGFGPEVMRHVPEHVAGREYGWSTTASAACTLPTTCSTDATRWCSSTPCPTAESPGTLHVFEADHETLTAGIGLDAHAMDPAAVFSSLAALGGTPP